MITCSIIEKDIIQTQSCYIWNYNNKPCGIDPVSGKFCLWYGEQDYTFQNMQELLDAKVFGGKSLREIVGEIKNYGIG